MQISFWTIIQKISIVKTIYFNYFCKAVKRYEKGMLWLYRNTYLKLDQGAQIIVRGSFWINQKKIPQSGKETSIVMQKNSKLIVNNEFRILAGTDIEVDKNATLTLQSGYMNEGSRIVCCKKISIGHGVIIGREVYIYDGDFHDIVEGKKIVNPKREIKIGNHVWIASRATILKGVRIGDGAVIGAGAVVTRDVPSGCLAVGNPAKVIRENITWK